MSRLVWGLPDKRVYEAGVDRVVLYPRLGPGVPWNGVISVEEKPEGGEARQAYYDGYKFQNLRGNEEYAASIQAYSSPAEFAPCEGKNQIANGLFVTQQRRQPFGFSYRSRIGNGASGLEHGYKLHLVYDALAGPAEVSHQTLGETVEPGIKTWEITTLSSTIPGYRPTAHLVIDSTATPDVLLSQIEDILYGYEEVQARQPGALEIRELFHTFTP